MSIRGLPQTPYGLRKLGGRRRTRFDSAFAPEAVPAVSGCNVARVGASVTLPLDLLPLWHASSTAPRWLGRTDTRGRHPRRESLRLYPALSNPRHSRHPRGGKHATVNVLPSGCRGCTQMALPRVITASNVFSSRSGTRPLGRGTIV